MPNASIKKIIACKKNDLIKMILDIEKYPEFVPWCLNGKIHKINDMDDIIEIEADLTVGKKFLNQTYKSHVTYYKNKDKILVNNIGAISISNKIIPKNIIDIIPEFDKLLHEAVDSLPVVLPANKTSLGVTVNSKFQLPIILKSN